jgi:CheY-like chemotaxis protein
LAQIVHNIFDLQKVCFVPGSNEHSNRAATTILVIDDEPVLRLTFQRLLEGEGYRVLVASNGREGVEIFQAQDVDLVITDIVMPELDGFRTIEKLRALRPDLPIIAMSAIADEHAMARPLSEPAFCCVAKPVQTNVLFALVKAILEPLPADTELS